MTEYRSPYDLIAEECPDVLIVLTEDEKDCLRGVLDYESIVLQVHGATVDTVDSINGDLLASESFVQFVRETIHFAIEDCKPAPAMLQSV